MTSTNRKSVALAGVGIAVLSIELLGLYAVAPRAWDLVQSGRSAALLDAGRRVAAQASMAVTASLTRTSAALLVRGLKNISGVYAMMLSVTPEARAEEACTNHACSVSAHLREASRPRNTRGYSSFSATDFAWRKSIK